MAARAPQGRGMKVRRLAWTAFGMVLTVGALAWAMRVPLLVAMTSRGVAARLAADPAAELPDGLHVGLCGAGSPFPDDRRSGPCTLVLAGQ
jgi:ribonuclease Z